MYQYSIPLFDWTIFHFMNVPLFIYPHFHLFSWWTFSMFPLLGYYKYCWCEHFMYRFLWQHLFSILLDIYLEVWTVNNVSPLNRKLALGIHILLCWEDTPQLLVLYFYEEWVMNLVKGCSSIYRNCAFFEYILLHHIILLYLMWCWVIYAKMVFVGCLNFSHTFIKTLFNTFSSISAGL